MSFTSQKYKKYFTLNHNGPKNVRTVQTIASIGVEMMPAGTDVDYGWVYINKVGQGCMTVFSRRAACWGEDATKSLVPFQGSALCGGAWGGMLPRGGLAQWRTFGGCSFFRVSVLCGLSLYVIMFVLIILPSVCAWPRCMNVDKKLKNGVSALLPD